MELLSLLKKLRPKLSDLGHCSGVKGQPTENQMSFSQTAEFCCCLFQTFE